jgi:hypothetical protein
VLPLGKEVWKVLKKLKIELPYDPVEMSTPGHLPKKMLRQDTIEIPIH